MAQKVEIEFTAKMEKYLSDILGAQRTTEAATGKMSEGFNNLNTSIKSVAGALGITLGAGALMSFAKSAVEGAAKLEVLRSNFKGTAADIELFRKATAGTVTEANLIRLSNQATDLGLTLKQQAILFSMADDAADKYGGSVEENFDRVLRASEGGSKGLKDLGIQKAKYDEIVAGYVEGYGAKQLDQLDAETQKWIQVESMIKAAGTTLNDVTGKLQDNADKLESIGVKWDNIKNKAGETLLPALTGILDLIISIDTWAVEAGNKIDRLLGLKGLFGTNESGNYTDPQQTADLKQALSSYTYVENGKIVSVPARPPGRIVKPGKTPQPRQKTYNTNIGKFGAPAKQYDLNNLPSLDIMSAEQMAKMAILESVRVPEGVEIDTDILKLDDAMERFGDTARQATNYLASGLARAIVYGENFADVLKNIGSMLLEAGLSFLINYGLRAGAAALGLPPIPFAGGGVITEPVMGVGMQSKRSYLFGEAGNEVVIPQKNYSAGEMKISLGGEFVLRGSDLYQVVKKIMKEEKRFR